MISNLKISNMTYNLYMLQKTQSANGSTDHLGAYSLMMGTGSVSGTTLSTTLTPLASVLQVNITFADELVGKTFGCLVAYFKDGSSANYNVDGTGNQVLSNSIVAKQPSFQQFYGSWSGTSIGPSGAASMEFNPKIDGAFNAHTKTVSLTNSCTLEPGKLYRVSVTID